VDAGRIGALALVVGLAAILRLWHVDLAPLRYDDVDVLSRARDVTLHGPTLTGPLTSWGVPDPPGSVYLLLPAAFFPSPPTVAVVWVGLLNVAAVALTYLLAERFHGRGVALAAGLLFAANPWAVYFSRRSWAEIVPLFTAIALWAAYEVVVGRRARWAVPFFLALAVQVQIRILSLIFGPAALLSLLLWPRRWGVRWPALGVLLGALLTVPYLTWVALHWADFAAKLSAGNRGVGLAPTNGFGALVLWLGAGFGLLPAASDVASWLDPLGQVGIGVLVLVGALLLAGLGSAALGLVRRREGWERQVLPSIWLVLPLLALVGQSSSVYLHYLVALFPAIFLVLALPIGWLLAHARRLLVAGGALILAALLAYQLTTTAVLYRVMAAYELADPPTEPASLRAAALAIPREASDALGTGERYGVEPPIRYWQAIADLAVTEAKAAGVSQAGDAQVWVLAGETDPLTAEVPAVLDYLLRPREEPRFLPPDLLIFQMLRPAIVVEMPDLDPVESLDRFGDRKGSVPAPSLNNRDSLARTRITSVPARGPQGWQSVAPTRLSAAFDGHIQMLGYRADQRQVRAGDSLPVTVVWWITSQSSVQAVPSLRLVDANGLAVSSEAPDRPLPALGLGDWVVVRRDQLAVPSWMRPGTYTLEVGLTDDETGRVLRRADQPAAGVPLGQVRVTAR
jgi:4-amino-4-deoxy-L-arabinose transferase-like glycosyltransferase